MNSVHLDLQSIDGWQTHQVRQSRTVSCHGAYCSLGNWFDIPESDSEAGPLTVIPGRAHVRKGEGSLTASLWAVPPPFLVAHQPPGTGAVEGGRGQNAKGDRD